MKNVNLKKEFDFLLSEGEKTTYSRRFSYKKGIKALIMAVVCITLVLLDCFFLGAGLIFAKFAKTGSFYKAFLVSAFVIKLIIDLIIAIFWVGIIQENAEKAQNTVFTVTDRSVLVTRMHDGIASFCKFDLSDAEIFVKKGLLSVKVTLKQGDKKTICPLPKSDYGKIKELLD